MPPTANSTGQPAPAPADGTSGRFVIIFILAVALIAAATSWWFRYFTTHRAIDFWGPQAALLIRDAPIVEFYPAGQGTDAARQSSLSNKSPEGAGRRDISHAAGLIHLRNALLEDQSYDWPAVAQRPANWGPVLVFREAPTGRTAAVRITDDGRYVDSPDHDRVLSCAPISAGLAEMAAEFAATPRGE